MRTPNIISTRNLANSGGYCNARGHPKYGKFILKMGPTETGFNFNQADMWFSRSIIFFRQRSVWVLTALIRFYFTYFCFDPNYITLVVASIQMLLARRILDVAYFRHYHYYSHLLLSSVTGEIDYKQQRFIETLALQRQNTILLPLGLLHRGRRYYDFCLNIGCVTIEKRAKQNISTWISLPVITNMCDHIFNCW